MGPADFSSIVRFHGFDARVAFRDVDGWGLVWHGNYFAYVDAARIELLKKFEIPFRDFPALGFVMPLVHVELDIKAASRADDAIVVEVAMRTRGAIVDTLFKIRETDRLLARGYTRQVFTEVGGRLLYHVPPVVAEKFARLYADALGE